MTNIHTTDPMLEISLGNIIGTTHVNKFGMNEDVDTGPREAIWEGGGDYTFLAVAEPLDIVSADVNDDGDPASTGAHTLEIIGLDTNWDPLTETITLDGLSNVRTAASFLRTFRMIIHTAGSTGGNEGLITATSASTTALQAAIPNGSDIHNQTEMAIFSVKRNATAAIVSYYGSINSESPGPASNPSTDLELLVHPFGEVFQVKHEKGLTRTGSSQFQHFFRPYLRVEGKSDIKIMAHVTDDDTAISAGFDIIIVDD